MKMMRCQTVMTREIDKRVMVCARVIFTPVIQNHLFRYELFVRFKAWTFVLHCVSEYVNVVIFVSFLTNSLVPRTVLRA